MLVNPGARAGRLPYYYRSTETQAGLSDDRLAALITEIQTRISGYGYRRVMHELRARGHRVNHKRVARVMKARGLGIRLRRRSTRTTDSDHDSPIFPNRYQNVIPDQPDRVWVTNFTCIRIATGFGYLAAILDACSRKVIGYAVSRQIDTELALAALRAAVANRRPPPETCIHHSDRGAQCCSVQYRKALEAFGLIGSTRSRGNPYHDAASRLPIFIDEA